MNDTPWTGDACSLVEAYRRGDHSPVEELEATLKAIERSGLNAFSHLDPEGSMQRAARADVGLPFGGVPIGVKELDSVALWPNTEASVPLKHRVSDHDSTSVGRLRAAGANIIGLTTASEFGGVNVTRTVLNGVTRNPWNPACTPGGSSGGTAAAVAGGLITFGTAGDGGGSIRIPAGFVGLVGLKCTYGRVPRGPKLQHGNHTTTAGTISRSVRDTARWLDVTNGHHPTDPFSLPRVDGYEAGLGHNTAVLKGLRTVIAPDWGDATVAPLVWEQVHAAAEQLITDVGMRRVDVDTNLPTMGAAWSISGMLAIHSELGDKWPDCADDLTPEIRFGMEVTIGRYSAEARHKIERRRMEVNEAMAALFDEVDVIMTASNPDVAFAAEGPLPSSFGGIDVGAKNNGRLTFPANLYGCPAIAIPAGAIDGLPVSLQIITRHFTEPLLLDAALTVERNRGWPLVAPGSPR